MTALLSSRGERMEKWAHHELTLKATKKAYQNGFAVGEKSSGKVIPAASATGLVMLGLFDESIDASSTGPLGAVDQPVTVHFDPEITVYWRPGDGTISASNLFSPCYFSDDQTVSLNSANQPLAGTIVGFNATTGEVAFTKDL